MKIIKKLISLIIAVSMINIVPLCVNAEVESGRYMENLDRGLVAMMKDEGVYLSWRLLGTEEYTTTFDVYRDGECIATNISDSTDYFDASGSQTSTYKVVSSNETAESVTKTVMPFSSGKNYIEIPVAPIEDYEINGKTYEYQIMDASCGDLDGDGEYEIVVKREANHNHAWFCEYGRRYLEAYKLDGTLLWRMDMGQNMLPMTEFVFLVYDFNCDGSAEIVCKTAPGSKDGTDKYVSEASLIDEIKNTDNEVSYHNPDGKIYRGPEYLTIFDGRNGQALDTIEYPILRGLVGDPENNYDVKLWVPSGKGDNAHRGEKCMGVVSYFDGQNPGITVWRGIYSRTAAANVAVDKETNRLSVENRFDTTDYIFNGLSEDDPRRFDNGYKKGYEKYEDQGNHSIACGDVDNDGKDEVISGSLCLDHDMTPLWCAYREHGDAHHLGEYDPTNNSLEYFIVHEHDGSERITDFNEKINLDFGMTLIHASDGKELFHAGNSGDTGRGMMTNVGAGGYFQFAGAGMGHSYGKIKDADGDPDTDSPDDVYDIRTNREDLFPTPTPETTEEPEQTEIPETTEEPEQTPTPYQQKGTYDENLKGSFGLNFRIFWDGDLYEESFDAGPAIKKYNIETDNVDTLFYEPETVTINSTKANPLLQADLFGDWREELVLKTPDDMSMRIYTTDIPTDNKLYTLMHDTLYRQGVALQNQYYNQPPHIGYYVCEKDDPMYNEEYDERDKQPNIQTVPYTANEPTATATPVKQAKTTRNKDYVIDEDGDYYRGVNDTSMVGNEWTVTADENSHKRQVLMSATNDAKYLLPAEAHEHLRSYNNKFLLFSANGSDTEFKHISEKSVSDKGVLEFNFSIPTTVSNNGSYPYGNAPTTMYIGDGTNKAVEFRAVPNVEKGYVTSANLYVNDELICTYETGKDAQRWTNVKCAIDNTGKKAYVTVTKFDGKSYSKEVSLSTDTAINTFGVSASKYYGTILLDEISLYETETLQKPTEGNTQTGEEITLPTDETTSEHLYELDLSNTSSGVITGKVTADETTSDTGMYNVADFNDGTAKTAEISELDGWGYTHKAYDNTEGRQTSASIDAENNAVVIQGTSNVGDAGISFIPKNVDNITLPKRGILKYTFTANTWSGGIDYGFTKASDGSYIDTVAVTNIEGDGEVVMKYNLDTYDYSITVNGTEKASGNAYGITGIFARSKRGSYAGGHISNLRLDVMESSIDEKPQPIPTQTETIDFDNRTLSATSTGNKTEFKIDAAQNLNATALADAGANKVLRIGSTGNGANYYFGYESMLKPGENNQAEAYSGKIRLAFKLEPIQARDNVDVYVVLQFADSSKKPILPITVRCGTKKIINVNGKDINTDYGNYYNVTYDLDFDNKTADIKLESADGKTMYASKNVAIEADDLTYLYYPNINWKQGYVAVDDIAISKLTIPVKEEVEITGVTVENRAYNGERITHTGTPVAEGYDGEFEFVYLKPDGTILQSAPKNVGEYKLVVRIPLENSGYKGSTEIPFEITKAPLTIKAEDVKVAVGTENPSLTYKAVGIKGNDKVKATLTCEYTKDSPEGEYTITPSDCVFTSGSADNYTVSYENGTLRACVIKQVTISGVSVANKTYDSIAVTHTGNATTNSGYDGEFVYEWQTKDGQVLETAPINAGEYKLVISIPQSEIEYVGSTEISFEIKKAQLTITANDFEIYEGEEVPTFTFTQTTLVGNDEIESVKLECEYNGEVGEYDITPSDCVFKTGSADNYEINYVKGNLIVKELNYGAEYKDGKAVVISKFDYPSVDVYVASYNADGTLESLIIEKNKELKAKEKCEITVDNENFVETENVKVFVWTNDFEPVKLK